MRGSRVGIPMTDLTRRFSGVAVPEEVGNRRLVVIQGFKRCPVNLRRLALVPKEYNAKGILGFSFPVTATYIMRLRQTPNLRKASALPIP